MNFENVPVKVFSRNARVPYSQHDRCKMKKGRVTWGSSHNSESCFEGSKITDLSESQYLKCSMHIPQKRLTCIGASTYNLENKEGNLNAENFAAKWETRGSKKTGIMGITTRVFFTTFANFFPLFLPIRQAAAHNIPVRLLHATMSTERLVSGN